MLDFQRFDSGFLDIVRLKSGYHAARLIAQRTHLVELCVVALTHETAVALQKRHFIGQGPIEMGCKACRYCLNRVTGRAKFIRQKCAFKQGANATGCFKAALQGTQIARTTATDRQTRERTRHIRHAFKFKPHRVGERLFAQEPRNGIMAQRDFCRVRKRRCQTFGKKTRAATGHGSINRFQQTAFAIAGHGTCQFKTGTGGGIDENRAAFLLAFRSHQRRTL
ncbi:hypothetical protein D9M70_503130 [compost metagenome]